MFVLSYKEKIFLHHRDFLPQLHWPCSYWSKSFPFNRRLPVCSAGLLQGHTLCCCGYCNRDDSGHKKRCVLLFIYVCCVELFCFMKHQMTCNLLSRNFFFASFTSNLIWWVNYVVVFPGKPDLSYVDPVVIGRGVFRTTNEFTCEVVGYIQGVLSFILDSVLDVVKGIKRIFYLTS